MLTTPHFTTRPLAEAHLAASEFTEIAVDTWLSPCGCHIASLRPVQMVALDVQPAPVVAVECAGVRQ